MKKIYLLLFSLLTVSFSFGQELLVNGTLEGWDDPNTPTGWTKVEMVDQESTEVHSGTFSAKHTGGTSDLGQTVSGIIPGTSYTVSLWYKVDAAFGDGTDARIWSYWKNGSSNLSDNADELRGPLNAYFDNNGNVWTQYTTTITAPATADNFYFELRTYGSAVVYWDDLSFFQEATAVPTLGVVSPTNGSNVPGPDVSVELSVQNFNVGPTSGGFDGHIHYNVDGGANIMKYDTDPINLIGLSAGSHTIDLELVDNSHNPLTPPVTANVTFTVYEVQALPLSEHFDYTVGENLADQSAWTNYFSGDDVVISAGNLSYSTLNGSGNSISFDGSGADPVVDYTPTSNGKIYSSFMLQVDALDTSAIDGYFAVLRTDGGDYAGRLWISPTSATTFRIGVSSGAALTAINTTDHNVGDVVFVVFNYDIDNNEVNAWVNPTLGGAEPAADLNDTSSSSGNTFTQFLIRQDNNTKTPFMIMDELRIGTSWTDVTPSTLSISQVEATAFNVYPNPTSTGYVNITSKTNDVINVTVFDILGKQVLKNTVNNNRLNVSTLTTGVYIMKISQNGQIITKKLVVK
ncbi:DUF6130 family protein [Xanthomarina sp. F2636L]|uniref:DUF6130 family protein n=1 Tax=Xanthomarina sp. F2636L TaxID=2996018 RepID=UPI00225E62AB|nr:T9SS type A sorting domain-containing protein [Xanthomarina sp. F2636L]MCX7550995.1 DUF6130 family protein [Xanthomarina sp. F2636L]